MMVVRRRHIRSWGNKKNRYDREGKRISITYSFFPPDGTQAKYPDIHIPQRISKTFKVWDELKGDQWLAEQERQIKAGTWVPPVIAKKRAKQKNILFTDYAQQWISHDARRGNAIADSTKEKYREMLRNHLAPAFQGLTLGQVTLARVEKWYYSMPVHVDRDGVAHGATIRWHTYTLLKAMMASASRKQPDGSPALIKENPCQIDAVRPPVAHQVVIVSLTDAKTLYNAMPPSIALTVYLGLMGLRRGEVLGLERKDIDFTNNTIRITRQSRENVGHGMVITPTKTRGSVRTIPIPDELVPLIKEHLDCYTGKSGNSFLFPGRLKNKTVSAQDLETAWRKARAHLPQTKTMHFHDLRHTAGTFLAQNGATTRETMAALGHTTVSTAMRYQHAARSRIRSVMDEEWKGVQLPDQSPANRKQEKKQREGK